MTTTPDETEVILDDPYLLHLPVADFDVKLSKIRTREALKLLRIIGAGAGPLIADMRITQDTAPEELAESLIALLLVSITDAEDEVIDFIHALVNPVDLIDPVKTKEQREENVKKYTDLYTKLDNPEAGDTIAILTQVIRNEAPNFLALGKQLAAMLPSAAKLTTSSKKPSRSSTASA